MICSLVGFELVCDEIQKEPSFSGHCIGRIPFSTKTDFSFEITSLILSIVLLQSNLRFYWPFGRII